jgi:hypothetical protein
MEFLLIYFLPRMYITRILDDELHINFINPNSSVAYMEFSSDHIQPPTGEIHIDAYDQLVEMVTSEGKTEDESMVVIREKNMVTLKFPIGEVRDFVIAMNWKFMRGSELKKMAQSIHIKL